MSGILKLESLNRGTTLKQGDKTVLSYRLSDADGGNLNIAGKTAVARLMYPDFTRIGYESGELTVSEDHIVRFSIDSIIPSRLYYLEITVDGQYIFPSRSDEGKLSIDRSSMGAEITIIENAGIDAVVSKAVDLINKDPSLILDEEKLIQGIIENTSVGSIEEYYNEFGNVLNEFNILKPKAEQSVAKSDEAIRVANSIDAKATSALGLSKSADELSRKVQSELNQIVSNGESSAEVTQARIDASGETNETLKDRLDKEHNEVTEKLAHISLNALHPPSSLQPLVADGNYYDQENFKYYSDEDMTVPATDNTPAMQNLVDYLYENGGGTLYLPKGKFVFRGEITWKSNVSLVGAGRGSTYLFSEGVIFSLIDRSKVSGSDGSSAENPDFEWLENCTFRDFAIDAKGLSSTAPSVSGKALFLLFMKRAVFRDLTLLNTIGTALGCDFLVDTVIDNVYVRNAGRNGKDYGGNSGIGVGTSALSKEPLVISNCFVYNCGNYGIFVETQNDTRPETFYAKVVNCHVEGNSKGFGNKGSGGTQFIGCTAVENLRHGFHLTQASYGDQIIACVANKNGEDGISVSTTYKGALNISNVKANENVRSGIAINVSVTTTWMKDVIISNIQTKGNGHNGVTIHGLLENLILSNVSAVENGQNSINSQTNRGILVSGQNKQVTITGSNVYDNQETKTQIVGIQVSNSTESLIVTGNNVISYSNSNAYQIPTHATFEGNSVPNYRRGTHQITDGALTAWFNHYLGKVPTKVIITPLGNEKLWVSANENNRTQVQRENSTGTVEFMWEVAW